MHRTGHTGIILFLVTLASIQLSLTSVARGEGESELAKETQNPVADLISIPFQNNMNFGLEPNHRMQNVLNVQPVIPFHLSERWNLITRTIMPILK